MKEHPHMEAARMEAAIEVLGIKAARLRDVIAVEKAKAQPDQQRIEQLTAKCRELGDLQDDLSPGDPRVALIRLDKESLDAAVVTDEDIAFFEEVMDLANPTPEDEAIFTAHIDQHGHGTGDK